MATEQQVPVIVARFVEHQSGFASLTTEDGQWVIQNTVEAISLFVEAVKNRAKTVAGYFRRLGLSVTIPVTTGKRTIAGARKVFTGYIDSDFTNWGLDVPGEAKPETKVEALELTKDGTFKDFFTSLGDLDKLVMTDDQIIWVVENRSDLLIMDGNANFFLKKVNGEFFVALVNRRGGGLRVEAWLLSSDYVWSAVYRLRVVVPQVLCVVPQS